MRSFLIIAIVLTALFACNNLEDANPAERDTFIRFFEGPYDLSASSLEIIPGGYVVLGNETIVLTDTAYTQTVLIETNEQGSRKGDIHTFGGGTGKSFKPLINNGAVSGYIVVGDRIDIDPQAEQAANVSIASMRILVVNNDFSVQKNVYIADKAPLTPANGGHPVKTDFFGGAVNLTSNGGAIVLGTFKEGLINQQAAPEKQLLFALNSTQDSLWFKTYDLLTNTYANARSVHYSNGKIIWATAIADVQGDFTSSYLAIPKVSEESVFENFNPFGQSTTQLFLPLDIQPARSAAFGFGVVGTYSQATDGSKSNMFFLRVDAEGNVIPGSDRYFDGIDSFAIGASDIDKDNSSIVDNGEAITSTKDGGFVLAGTMTTNPTKGNGGKDIFLVKVTGQGTMLWAKTLGGSGDEVVSAIRETADGGLILCGTNKLGDYSTIFLIKTDKNGALKN
jgi:hypothetical protein